MALNPIAGDLFSGKTVAIPQGRYNCDGLITSEKMTRRRVRKIVGNRCDGAELSRVQLVDDDVEPMRARAFGCARVKSNCGVMDTEILDECVISEGGK